MEKKIPADQLTGAQEKTTQQSKSKRKKKVWGPLPKWRSAVGSKPPFFAILGAAPDRLCTKNRVANRLTRLQNGSADNDTSSVPCKT